jgi:methylmalonyl-CoA mutase cobalamin-binding subunit
MVGSDSRLGVALVEIALKLCGLQAHGLSGELMPKDLAEAAQQMGADLVWVSHAHASSPSQVIEWHRELDRNLPRHVRVLVGGGALSPSILRQLPAHDYYPSLSSMWGRVA